MACDTPSHIWHAQRTLRACVVTAFCFHLQQLQSAARLHLRTFWKKKKNTHELICTSLRMFHYPTSWRISPKRALFSAYVRSFVCKGQLQFVIPAQTEITEGSNAPLDSRLAPNSQFVSAANSNACMHTRGHAGPSLRRGVPGDRPGPPHSDISAHETFGGQRHLWRQTSNNVTQSGMLIWLYSQNTGEIYTQLGTNNIKLPGYRLFLFLFF
jgi:hypothetical protein